MFTSLTNIMILLFGGSTVFLMFIFYRQQNQSCSLGGAISLAKTFWLAYAIFMYFLLTPTLCFDKNIDGLYRCILASFSVLMWLRGGIQFVLLYRTKRWKPIMGISHNLFCVAFIGAEYFLLRDRISMVPVSETGNWMESFIVVIIMTLLTDSYYAFRFNQIVEGHTIGAQGIWFASKNESRFQGVNRLTCLLNGGFYGYLCIFLLKGFASI